MNADTIAALINMGSAGAVIGIVIVFLRFIEKRDKEWRDFFTIIIQGDKDTLNVIIATLKDQSALLQSHDLATRQAIATMEERTTARKTTPRRTANKS